MAQCTRAVAAALESHLQAKASQPARWSVQQLCELTYGASTARCLWLL